MRRIILSLAGMGVCLFSYAGKIVLEGNYQAKNIFVINSLATSGAGFCTYEVTINGDISLDEINGNAFEIDLSIYDLELGEQVFIEIKYKEGCSPKVLNPGVLKPQPSFTAENVEIDRTGLVSWTTSNETSSLPFVIQQYKWNKWVNVGEVQGVGTPDKHYYEFKAILTSGTNKFRVMQGGRGQRTKYSEAVTVNAMRPKPSFIYNKKTQSVEFSRKTIYELFDEYGRVAKAGFGLKVDIANLQKGIYFLNFDNTSQTFAKK